MKITGKHLSSLLLGLVLTASYSALADGPADNKFDQVRPVPPPGKQVADADRSELEQGLKTLRQQIDSLPAELKSKPALLKLIPDVEIFHKAVHYALSYNEFFNPSNEVPTARTLLQQGMERASQLRQGLAPWTTATGLVVRGYVSKLDGSVQPYGLVVPASFQQDRVPPFRLDFWFHGRGETLSELNFLRDRMRNPGEFVPRDAFVLHPYSRYCNGQKLAGEIDGLEALEHVMQQYPIDPERLVVRGFSLGGAACWHYAVHYAGRWAAAAPGAGFSETPDFLKVFQNETLQPTPWEKKLWHWYDCTDYAINLAQCPTVAYSGEKDNQKQAADIMAKAMQEVGLDLTHIIGAGAGHNYTPAARAEINRRIDSIVAKGRNPMPRSVHFTTWTLQYPSMAWVKLEALQQHWERAQVDAEIVDDRKILVRTANVEAMTLDVPSGWASFPHGKPVMVEIDGQTLQGPAVKSDRSWTLSLGRNGGAWTALSGGYKPEGLRKRPGLQGPIDAALMDSFIFVKPSGKGWHPDTEERVNQEMKRAVTEWRRQFRGDVRIKLDTEITSQDVTNHNLILWGDPSSNQWIAKVLPKLPMQWTSSTLQLGGKEFASENHLPLMVYPNPENPARYVVFNSSCTFREYDYLNNARQVPKLPDYAVIDVRTPANARYAGQVVHADFFNETWQIGK